MDRVEKHPQIEKGRSIPESASVKKLKFLPASPLQRLNLNGGQIGFGSIDQGDMGFHALQVMLDFDGVEALGGMLIEPGKSFRIFGLAPHRKV